MDQLELVERLREKTGCSYSEAKAALAESGNDLLEALCWLESHGKTQLVGVSCSTEDREPPKTEPAPEPKAKQKNGPNPVSEGFKSLWEGMVGLLRKCNQTEVIMTNKAGRKEFGIPLTLFIILLLVAFWVVLALIVVAMFFGNRFSVAGAFGTDDVNEVLNKAADLTEDIKDEFKDNEEQK